MSKSQQLRLTEGTLFELAINGLTARQGTSRAGRIGADLTRICGAHCQGRTSRAQPIRSLAVAVGIGTEAGSSF